MRSIDGLDLVALINNCRGKNNNTRLNLYQTVLSIVVWKPEIN